MSHLAITGWGVVSPLGIGADEFTVAINEGRSGRGLVTEQYAEQLPDTEAYVLEKYKISEHLGRKGTSSFDRTVAFAVHASALALQDTDLVIDDGNRAEVGVVVGTSTGSLRSTSDYTRETYVNDRPHLVNPVLFPNALINCAAGYSALRHHLTGINTTVSEGQLSGLAAFRYARNAIRSGYATALVTGAVEEYTPHSAWMAHHHRETSGGQLPPGEGSAMFVLENADQVRSAGRKVLGEILGVEIAFSDESGAAQATVLAQCLRRLLSDTGVQPGDVWAVASGANGSERLDTVEHTAVTEVLGGDPPRWLRTKELLGETYSAAGAFQLATVLGLHRVDSTVDGMISLITSVGQEGLVGVTAVRGWHHDLGDNRV